MNCESLLDHATGFLDGSLARPDRKAVVRHLAGCADCRGLFAALAAAPSEDPVLAGAILARTTGGVCDSARSRLCARVDGDLEPFDADLVDGHLRHCPDCAGLARALRVSAEELSRCAAIDPGPGFVEAILARTSGRPRPVPLAERWAAAVSRLLDRPRIAIEGAFAAMALVGMPAMVFQAPLADGSVAAVAHVRGAVNEIEASVVVGTRAAWAMTESFAVEHSVAVASEVSRRSTDTLESIRLRYGTFSGPAASRRKGGGTGTIDRNLEAPQETEQ
jgi:anti-sigma factor RsiW